MNDTIQKVARAIRENAYNFKRTIPVKTPAGVVMVEETNMNYEDIAKAAITAHLEALAGGELNKAGLQAALEFDTASDKIRAFLTALKDSK